MFTRFLKTFKRNKTTNAGILNQSPQMSADNLETSNGLVNPKNVSHPGPGDAMNHASMPPEESVNPLPHVTDNKNGDNGWEGDSERRSNVEPF